MTADHVVELASAALALLGVLAGVLASVWIAFKVKSGRSNHDRENRAYDITSTPASPGILSRDIEALQLARDAMREVKEANKRLARVEQELEDLQFSYRALKIWARRIRRDWDEIRKSRYPPDLPEE